MVLQDDVLLAQDVLPLLDERAGLASVFCAEEPIMVQLTHVERGHRVGAHTIGRWAIVRPHGGVWRTSALF